MQQWFVFLGINLVMMFLFMIQLIVNIKYYLIKVESRKMRVSEPDAVNKSKIKLQMEHKRFRDSLHYKDNNERLHHFLLIILIFLFFYSNLIVHSFVSVKCYEWTS